METITYIEVRPITRILNCTICYLKSSDRFEGKLFIGSIDLSYRYYMFINSFFYVCIFVLKILSSCMFFNFL